MAYTSITINYSTDNLCDEINFSEPGKVLYEVGSTITISDRRLWRDRKVIVQNIKYTEEGEAGLFTTVSCLSEEYKYTRISPNCDISFFTMGASNTLSGGISEQSSYLTGNPKPESKVYMMDGDIYGVGGWSMHSVIQKIVEEWMGLSVENNLPDFWISDFTISLGSTFFEAVTGLISVFEPIIVLSYGTLYILERGGAGALGGSAFLLENTFSKSVDYEHVPIPGCILVEGLEGMYIADKDVAGGVTIGGISVTMGADGSTNETMEYLEGPFGGIALQSGIGNWGFGGGAGSNSSTMYYDSNGRPTRRVERQQSPGVGTTSITITTYSYFMNGDLKEQVSVKSELFVYNSEANSYAKYDGRDHCNTAMATYETFQMIEKTEVSCTRYTLILNAVYSVDTITATKTWNLEEEMWITTCITNHSLVMAGDQQHLSSNPAADRTLQVYAGTCPIDPDDFSVLDEPPAVFNVSTPDWDSIEDCYTYLAELVAYEFQKVTAIAPIIDPLPLMAVRGLGSIIESEIHGYNYITGYSINIDSNEGYTVELTMEARRT